MSKKSKKALFFKTRQSIVLPVVIGLLSIFIASTYAQLPGPPTVKVNNPRASSKTHTAAAINDRSSKTSNVTKPVVPVKTPVIPQKPTSTPPHVTPAINTPPKDVPIVTPAPNSSVSSLKPVSQSPTSSDPKPSTASPPPSAPTSSPATSPPTAGYSSTNWSGYMASNGSFTTISGSWIAPDPTGTPGIETADAAWIGIGGVSTSDLIQVGSQNTISASGTKSTSGFFELLPAASQLIPNVQVSPGDSLTASINQISTGHWSIVFKNLTNGQNYSAQVNYASSLSTAEWIEEDPSYSNNTLVPFDNFGTINFSNGLTTKDGSSLTISGSVGQKITMVNSSGKPIATPSDLSANGSGFSVVRNLPN
ncbi:MAG: hypothetical protein NVS1B10_07710 [Candidatus Saccharimonadales bacterium]